MKRELALRNRLKSQQTLLEAVSAMKSLSAHHLRVARAAIPAARAYRDQVDEAVAAIGISHPMKSTAPPGLLLVASDLGLCDGYVSRLSQRALQENERTRFGVVYGVGRRALGALARAGVTISRRYRSPTSVGGLTGVLLQLAQDTLSDFLSERISSLDVVSARFEGVGVFTPVLVRVLPLTPLRQRTPTRETPYVRPPHLVAVAVREFLYITLYELLLDALASEHGARLVATETAGEWLSARTGETRRQIAAVRRESATQEVLDIVAGARARRRRPNAPTE